MYPCARTRASAAGNPSAAAAPLSFSANAGAVAVRVLVAGVPPEAPPPVVVWAGVVAAPVVGWAAGAVACEVLGEPATDTVLVAVPHPPQRTSDAAARAAITGIGVWEPSIDARERVVDARERVGWAIGMMVLSGDSRSYASLEKLISDC